MYVMDNDYINNEKEKQERRLYGKVVKHVVNRMVMNILRCEVLYSEQIMITDVIEGNCK